MVLMEVIVALSIFVLVAFSLVVTLNASFEAARERNEIETATRGMENQLTMLHAGKISLVDKDMEDDGSGVLYHLTIAPEQLKDQKGQPLNGMIRATITAKWKSDGQEENRSETELIYQP